MMSRGGSLAHRGCGGPQEPGVTMLGTDVVSDPRAGSVVA
jgi:hypothetical protein